MDCFIKGFWQVLGVVAALAISTMVILAIAAPDVYDVVAARLLHAILPWITTGIMVMIVWKVVIAPMLPKKGGKKDG